MKHLALIQLTVALLLFAGIVTAYGLWYRVVGKTSAHAAQLSVDIETKTQDSARVAAAKVALSELAADESGVHQYLVPTNDVVPFLEGLEQTGRQLGAEVEVASVSAESKTSRPHLTLSLKITGSFDSVLRTLGAIEYGPYDSALGTVTFDTPRVGDSTAPSVWTATATFTIGTQVATP